MSDFQLIYQHLPEDEDNTDVKNVLLRTPARVSNFTVKIANESIIAYSGRDYLITPITRISGWFIYNWWFLFYEGMKEDKTSGWAQRHNLMTADSSLVLPNLSIFKYDRDSICLKWKESEATKTSGSLILSREEIQQTIKQFNNEIMACSKAFHSTYNEDWQVILKQDQEENEYCADAAALGYDAYTSTEADQFDDIAANPEKYLTSANLELREYAKQHAKLSN